MVAICLLLELSSRGTSFVSFHTPYHAMLRADMFVSSCCCCWCGDSLSPQRSLRTPHPRRAPLCSPNPCLLLYTHIIFLCFSTHGTFTMGTVNDITPCSPPVHDRSPAPPSDFPFSLLHRLYCPVLLFFFLLFHLSLFSLFRSVSPLLFLRLAI